MFATKSKPLGGAREPAGGRQLLNAFVCYPALSCDVCRSDPAERLARRARQRALMLEQSGQPGGSLPATVTRSSPEQV